MAPTRISAEALEVSAKQPKSFVIKEEAKEERAGYHPVVRESDDDDEGNQNGNANCAVDSGTTSVPAKKRLSCDDGDEASSSLGSVSLKRKKSSSIERSATWNDYASTSGVAAVSPEKKNNKDDFEASIIARRKKWENEPFVTTNSYVKKMKYRSGAYAIIRTLNEAMPKPLTKETALTIDEITRDAEKYCDSPLKKFHPLIQTSVFAAWHEGVKTLEKHELVNRTNRGKYGHTFYLTENGESFADALSRRVELGQLPVQEPTKKKLATNFAPSSNQSILSFFSPKRSIKTEKK